jgi:hypothetical protein
MDWSHLHSEAIDMDCVRCLSICYQIEINQRCDGEWGGGRYGIGKGGWWLVVVFLWCGERCGFLGFSASS